jgi:hypothetical protein
VTREIVGVFDAVSLQPSTIKSALVKYQAVKKKDSIVKKLQRLFTKKSKRLLHLRCQCYRKT